MDRDRWADFDNNEMELLRQLLFRASAPAGLEREHAEMQDEVYFEWNNVRRLELVEDPAYPGVFAVQHRSEALVQMESRA